MKKQELTELTDQLKSSVDRLVGDIQFHADFKTWNQEVSIHEDHQIGDDIEAVLITLRQLIDKSGIKVHV